MGNTQAPIYGMVQTGLGALRERIQTERSSGPIYGSSGPIYGTVQTGLGAPQPPSGASWWQALQPKARQPKAVAYGWKSAPNPADYLARYGDQWSGLKPQQTQGPGGGPGSWQGYLQGEKRWAGLAPERATAQLVNYNPNSPGFQAPKPDQQSRLLRSAISNYVTQTLGNDGAIPPQLLNAMRERVRRDVMRSAMNAAPSGAFGGSIMRRGMAEAVGDKLLDLEMQNALQGLQARQAAAQLGAQFAGQLTDDQLRLAQLQEDALRWRAGRQDENFWKQVATNQDALRWAAGRNDENFWRGQADTLAKAQFGLRADQWSTARQDENFWKAMARDDENYWRGMADTMDRATLLAGADQWALGREDENFWRQAQFNADRAKEAWDTNDANYWKAVQAEDQRREMEQRLLSQQVADYLNWKKMEQEMWWKPMEFAAGLAGKEREAYAAALAGKQNMWGNIMQPFGMLSGYALGAESSK